MGPCMQAMPHCGTASGLTRTKYRGGEGGSGERKYKIGF
jgi:hypothetical protein